MEINPLFGQIKCRSCRPHLYSAGNSRLKHGLVNQFQSRSNSITSEDNVLSFAATATSTMTLVWQSPWILNLVKALQFQKPIKMSSSFWKSYILFLLPFHNFMCAFSDHGSNTVVLLWNIIRTLNLFLFETTKTVIVLFSGCGFHLLFLLNNKLMDLVFKYQFIDNTELIKYKKYIVEIKHVFCNFKMSNESL